MGVVVFTWVGGVTVGVVGVLLGVSPSEAATEAAAAAVAMYWERVSMLLPVNLKL